MRCHAVMGVRHNPDYVKVFDLTRFSCGARCAVACAWCAGIVRGSRRADCDFQMDSLGGSRRREVPDSRNSGAKMFRKTFHSSDLSPVVEFHCFLLS